MFVMQGQLQTKNWKREGYTILKDRSVHIPLHVHKEPTDDGGLKKGNIWELDLRGRARTVTVVEYHTV